MKSLARRARSPRSSGRARTSRSRSPRSPARPSSFGGQPDLQPGGRHRPGRGQPGRLHRPARPGVDGEGARVTGARYVPDLDRPRRLPGAARGPGARGRRGRRRVAPGLVRAHGGRRRPRHGRRRSRRRCASLDELQLGRRRSRAIRRASGSDEVAAGEGALRDVERALGAARRRSRRPASRRGPPPGRGCRPARDEVAAAQPGMRRRARDEGAPATPRGASRPARCASGGDQAPGPRPGEGGAQVAAAEREPVGVAGADHQRAWARAAPRRRSRGSGAAPRNGRPGSGTG